MKKIVSITVISLFAACSVMAQEASPLSDRGVGTFTSFAGSRSAGMGNAGLALIGNGYLNRLNPATWIGLENVQITPSFDFAGVTSEDNSLSSSSYASNSDFAGGIFAIPIDKGLGISMAGGFTPLSTYKYKINSLSSVPELQGSYYSVNKNGSGGLGEAFFGASVSPVVGVGIGATFQYAFGRTETVTSVNFDSTGFNSSYTDHSMYLRGPGGTVGLVLGDLDKLTGISLLKGVMLAGYYRYAYKLTGSDEINSVYPDGLDTTFSSGASGYIPPEFGIGIAKVFGNGLSAVLDVRTQQLSKYHDSFTSRGTLRNTLFIGGGVEYLQGRSIRSLFAKRVLRVGFYYNKTQFVVPTKSGQEKQVNELFGTAGIELPLSYTATLDVGLQYGFRGLASDLLLHERVLRLYVSFTMGEAWFLRPQVQ